MAPPGDRRGRRGRSGGGGCCEGRRERLARLERQNVELIHEVARQQETRAGLEVAWRDILQGAKSDHALQVSEIARSVSAQQLLANMRRREMSELTSRAETVIREEQARQRKLRARLQQLNVGFQLGLKSYFGLDVN